MFNHLYIEAELFYITENEIDLALLKIKDSDKDILFNNNIKGLEINKNIKVKELDEVYCLNYHYFNKQDLNNFDSCFYTVRLH